MTEYCPTCGGAVEVVTADEGTSSYRPSRPHLLTDEMVERAAGALWDHQEFEERRWPPHEGPLWAEVVEGGFFPGDQGDQRDVRAEARAALEAALGAR